MNAEPMRITVLGLSLSSSWGNGHATTWRALLRGLAARGHRITFLERDVPWYRAHRDLPEPDFCALHFYSELSHLEAHAAQVAQADLVILGSYVPDGIDVARWIFKTAKGVTAFYDIDTPVTVASLEAGACAYLAAEDIRRFDLYFSFTGGPILDELARVYGAQRALPLYCSVDPELYAPLPGRKRYDLSYLGTYSADRQPALERLLIEPARRMPQLRFAVAGPQYPDDIAWPTNVARIDHVPPAEHAAFYSQSRFTLNVTRADMVKFGYSPSVRLFEAAACATPIISDRWIGLDTLFEPGREIVIADQTQDVLVALADPEAAEPMGLSARRRVLAAHSASHRAAELEHAVRAVRGGRKVDDAVNAPSHARVGSPVLVRDL